MLCYATLCKDMENVTDTNKACREFHALKKVRLKQEKGAYVARLKRSTCCPKPIYSNNTMRIDKHTMATC